jgi:hypothetical protein
MKSKVERQFFRSNNSVTFIVESLIPSYLFRWAGCLLANNVNFVYHLVERINL